MESQTQYKFMSATGRLPYNMTNDYMFRVVLQRDPETLVRLICSVLHISREDVVDVTIENPITPGEAIDEKEYQLDIFVSLNNNTYINLDYSDFRVIPINHFDNRYDSIFI